MLREELITTNSDKQKRKDADASRGTDYYQQ